MERHCILNAGPVDDDFRAKFGDYSTLFVKMLSSTLRPIKFDSFDAYKDIFPVSLEDYSVIYITGSRFGAHEDVQFILKLSSLIRKIVKDYPTKRLIGICFGHQLIAHSLGGLSGPSPDEIGWELGLKELSFQREALRSVFPSLNLEELCSRAPLRILEVHRDQVKALPPNATLIASSSRTAYEAYALGKQVFCMQGHPEFSPEIVAYLLGTKEGLEVAPPNVPLYSPDNEIFVQMIMEFTQPSRARL